ncbi:MAG: DUF72 domain-containing protein [Dehalococcoidales bacterium]|nr:DUF72 domain-containing protein [Dehalococcoidales bacterium]
MNVYIGTSGWSYPRGEGTWNGNFYPPGKINELEYYCRFFRTVEVNSSFYRPPAPAMTAKWARQTPDGFRFAVKLWQKFTHPQMFEAATGEAALISSKDVILFQSGIEPLVKTSKLGALLAQFPPSFKNNKSGRQFLDAVIAAFRKYPLAIELRNRSWSDDPATASFFRENNVAWVQIDEPRFSSSVAAELPVTADTAYFRFHGRNAAEWRHGNNETRYKYMYSPEEITELAQKLNAAAQQTKLTFAFFNNHWKGWAPRNAVDMMKSLGQPVNELPGFGAGLFPSE